MERINMAIYRKKIAEIKQEAARAAFIKEQENQCKIIKTYLSTGLYM
jgi:hypothetical protein